MLTVTAGAIGLTTEYPCLLVAFCKHQPNQDVGVMLAVGLEAANSKPDLRQV